MSTTLERSLSRASNMSIPVSPRLTVHRDVTPPTVPDSISELRAVILTRDEYVHRRNKEDEHIRREFEAHRTISHRIDTKVTIVQTDVGHLKTDVSRLKSDVNLLKIDVNYIKQELASQKQDTARRFDEVGKSISTLRGDLDQRFSGLEDRFASMEQKYTIMDQIRFNAISTSLNACLKPVPRVGKNGTLVYPDYFPPTVLVFWRLKFPRYVDRLIQLAEFYELGGYDYWGRELILLEDEDLSDSSDGPNKLTRAEAARRHPEACHRALAAAIGLSYRKIRKEWYEYCLSSPSSTPPKTMTPPRRRTDEYSSSRHGAADEIPTSRKRDFDEHSTSRHGVADENPTSRKRHADEASSHSQRSPKRHAGDVDLVMLKRIVDALPQRHRMNRPLSWYADLCRPYRSHHSKSPSPEPVERVEYRYNRTSIDVESVSKLDDIGILRALEQRKIQVRDEHMHVSPNKARHTDAQSESEVVAAQPKDTAPMDTMPLDTVPLDTAPFKETAAAGENDLSHHTVSTEAISPTGAVPDTASMATSTSS